MMSTDVMVVMLLHGVILCIVLYVVSGLTSKVDYIHQDLITLSTNIQVQHDSIYVNTKRPVWWRYQGGK